MTHTPGRAAPHPRIVVVGSGSAGREAKTALLAAGITGTTVLDRRLRPDHEIIGSVFDDDTDTWMLHTATGEVIRADIVVATHRPPYVPWIPDLPGQHRFRGAAFHAANRDPHFDPAGKHIAMVGIDSTASYHCGQLAESASSVNVFAHLPRRIISMAPVLAGRISLRRQARSATLARSHIDALTTNGIRTNDGIEHRVDTIIYGTGFTIPRQLLETTLVGAKGLTIQQAWVDGMEPFFGMAIHGFPNYFFVSGPKVDAQISYLIECIELMKTSASTRLGLRLSSQRVFNERISLKPTQPPRPARAFDLSAPVTEDDEAYDGPATLTIADTPYRVHVQLTGHLDPLDGQYHWQGMIFTPLPKGILTRARETTLSVHDHPAPARIVEQTPWGTHSIAGVGAAPHAQIGP